MIIINRDYDGFSGRFFKYLKNKDVDLKVSIIANDNPESIICDVNESPFATNPNASFGKEYVIVYNPNIIEKCKLTQSETDACILHEIGHLTNREIKRGINLEIQCDRVACEANMALPMLSSLFKMQDIIGIDMQERINAASSMILLYRPEWTCGRYNEKKQVAIMYNLIAGFSYFFEGYSASVIAEILKSGRNMKINIEDIISATGICLESLLPFFIILTQNGLLTEMPPTEEDIENYRHTILEARKDDRSWVDKSTEEKIPMAVTNAEQAYYNAVDDGKTICSCMFELTYRCSEMCIHCYNPGATRNSTEISRRADQQELTFEDYRRIIDDMYDNGLVKVCLSGGDPFSKEFVWKLIKYLYDKDIAVDVFTNGLRLTDCVGRLARYYPHLIGVSIYSGIAKDHDAITRIPGSWEKSMQVVKEIYSMAIPMNLKCCVMQPNLHSYYMVADIAKEYGAVPQFEINITESNEGDICAKQLRLTEKQLQVVLRDNNLALYVGKEAPNYGGQKRDLSLSSCGAGVTGFCMSPNGNLRACTAFTQTYGNLQKQSIKDVLTGSIELKTWRKAVVADYLECGKHDYCDYCNLCAGVNYTEHKDFRKPAETNCYMAKCRHNLALKLMRQYEPMDREQLVEALQKLSIEEVVLQRNFRNKG